MPLVASANSDRLETSIEKLAKAYRNLAAKAGTSTHGLGLSADIDVRDPQTLSTAS